MTNPFREAPRMLTCPRCGQTLNDVTGDVAMCGQCGGIWLAQPVIATAFQDPTWPHGVSMWWRRELVCPVCAANGTDETMASVMVDELMLDRCPDHGLWFDRGELARLIGGTPAKELDRLKSILESTKAPAWVVEAQQRRETERRIREEELARAEAEASAKREAARQAAIDEEARKRREQASRIELHVERDELVQQIEAIGSRLQTMHESIASDEERLREMRARLRMVQNQLSALDP